MISYRFKPDQYSSHSKIIKIVQRMNSGMKILDVGCSTGYLAKMFSDMKNDVWGIESDPNAAKLARVSCKDVVVGDVETASFKYKNNFFDVIIFADVLEHLKDPLNVLIKFKKCLKKDGIIIASTSNIANLYMRLKLLFGNFEYTDRGILDKTHLRFFTLKAFKKLMEDAGLKITKTDVTPIPLPMVFPSTAKGKPLNFVHHINYLMTKILRTLFAFQFILVVKK